MLLFGICNLGIGIFDARAGIDNFPLGARSAGLGGASVSLGDVWSASNNQAGLAFVKNFTAGAYYENRFFISQLSLKGGAVALPVKAGTFGLVISNFGYSLYNESKYGLSFAKSFGDVLSAGVQLDYLGTRIAEGYGSKNVVAGEFGIQAKPLKGLTVGAHIFNPSRTTWTSDPVFPERVPTIVRFGMDYRFSEKVFVALETEKDIDYKNNFKAGFEYKATKEFYLRAGVSSNPNLTCLGFGLNLKGFRLDVSSSYHPVLGISTAIGLMYELNSK